MNYKIFKLTKKTLNEIWKKARKIDKEEFSIQGVTDSNIYVLLEQRAAFVGKVGSKPVAAFGFSESVNTLWIFFLATDEINNHMKTFTKGAKAYLIWMRDKYPMKRILVRVWDKHSTSIRWLKHLGFEYTNFSYGPTDERFEVYELRR